MKRGKKAGGPAAAKADLARFLAAPESTLKNKAERLKLAQRKAHEEALAAQELDSKRREPPSVEDVLADLVRVAESEELNPLGHADRSLTAKRYRRFGLYPVSRVYEMFGQFEHAKQVAGLEDEPGTRRKKAARAEASRREHARRYAERWILPYVARRDELARELSGVEVVLSISDTHATFLDPFTWYCFLRACRDLEPDRVVLNGDALEGSEITRYPKIPGWTVPLQLEFDFVREMFRQLRAVLPDAELTWTAGNHGLDRLASYLTQVAPAFASLRTLRFDQLAGVEEFDVRLAQGGTIASPAGTEDDPPGILIGGFYRVHHGTKLGATPALAELQAARRSGQSGHVHRGGVAYGTTEAEAGLSWMSTPMGCTARAGRAYMKGVTTGWQRGFGVAFLMPGGRVHQYPVVTDGGQCVVEGFHYRRDELPGGEPDPSRLWLPDFTEGLK